MLDLLEKNNYRFSDSEFFFLSPIRPIFHPGFSPYFQLLLSSNHVAGLANVLYLFPPLSFKKLFSFATGSNYCVTRLKNGSKVELCKKVVNQFHKAVLKPFYKTFTDLFMKGLWNRVIKQTRTRFCCENITKHCGNICKTVTK